MGERDHALWRRRRGLQELEQVVGGAVQHALHKLAERHHSVAHKAGARPVARRERGKQSDEATSRQVELEEELFGWKYRAGGRRRGDTNWVDAWTVINSEASDAIGGGVVLVAQAGNALQR